MHDISHKFAYTKTNMTNKHIKIILRSTMYDCKNNFFSHQASTVFGLDNGFFNDVIPLLSRKSLWRGLRFFNEFYEVYVLNRLLAKVEHRWHFVKVII